MEEKTREDSSLPPVDNRKGKSDERRLIEAAQNGDKKAFGSLIRLHQKKLFRFVYGLTRSFDQSEDLVQESFVRAYQAIKTFRAEYAFYPWLATIARNLTYNYLHREEKKESLEKLEEVGFKPVDESLGPLDRLIDDEGKRRFYRALRAMPVKYRSVFVLRHFEGLDYSRIGSYLKIPPGTVDSRLYRARQFLLEELKDLL